MSKDIAVVTGASGGIGAAVAKMIHEKSEGALRICLHYNGNKNNAEKIQREIPNSFIAQADLATANGRKFLLDSVLAEGEPFVLVNNAGIDRPHEPALTISEEAFDKFIGTNLRGPLFLMRDFGREMARAEAGVIVNVSSILARMAVPGSALYRASKAALEAMTKQFAAELGPKGVRVNAVAPGFIDTPMTDALSPEMRATFLKSIALGRLGSPRAAAETIWHCIESDYLNGAVIALDGGMGL